MEQQNFTGMFRQPTGCGYFEVLKINGKKEGFARHYNNDGEIQSEVLYVNNKREGLCKEYFPGGQIKEECLYINGKREGQYKKYWNSQIFETGIYMNDKEIKEKIKYKNT